MFYRTYRPKTIAQLDNSQAKEVISNILASQNLPHAFLYVGSKGTGKTSTARIFAKAINCLQNKFAGKSKLIEPCNTCTNCLSIDKGTSPDVLEMDAASNRGIDEVRSLIRESAYLPISCRYRVYIIDEAHMITRDAFNALLKTLEEPPASVIFILATTNAEKVPETIISRCNIIQFGTAKKDDILNQLKRITVAEKITVKDEVLQLIAMNSEKSFRDAAKLLEELTIQQALTLDKAKEYIGARSYEELLTLLTKNKLQESLQWVNEFAQTGGNIKMLIESMLTLLQQAFLAKNGVKQDHEINIDLSIPQITQLMKVLTEAYTSLKVSPIVSIPLEIALVEFYNYRIAD